MFGGHSAKLYMCDDWKSYTPPRDQSPAPLSRESTSCGKRPQRDPISASIEDIVLAAGDIYELFIRCPVCTTSCKIIIQDEEIFGQDPGELACPEREELDDDGDRPMDFI